MSSTGNEQWTHQGSNDQRQRQHQQQQQYYNNFTSPGAEARANNAPEEYKIFSDGYGTFLRVYPNQKCEMFTHPQQFVTPQTDARYENHHHHHQTGNGDLQGNFFINQLVGNWTPGTSILGSERMVSVPQQPQIPIPSQNDSIINNDAVPIVANSSPQKPLIATTEKIPLKKPRAVAEVKPMRMSYSDVLSKNVPASEQTPRQTVTSNTVTSPSNATLQQGTKKEGGGGGKKQIDKGSKFDLAEKFRKREEKKNQPSNLANKIETNSKDSESAKKKKQKEVNKKEKTKPKQAKITNFSKLGDEFEVEAQDTEYFDDGTDGFDMYNVRKTENYDKSMKISKSSKKSNQSSGNNKSQISKQEKASFKRGQKGRKSQRIEILEKIWSVWLEYILKFLTWLWSLVSDVILLSYGLASDRIIAGFSYIQQAYHCLRMEFNANRPSAWIRYAWQEIDGKFQKDSKWAFWRKKTRNSTSETSGNGEPKDYYKDGRLPTTADEAMYSLLNCKGKDAYSILGVGPDCSQEQIRKHYKKIAVLVHPDKNKQPGAEEAFKVLQRSFELIGEPENRQQYDQSMAEALNAEKAWSELNDLLKQLHTKIAEAANTIRCSNCNCRHPRKPTGRPPYAARECNSCRIRHSAREGDIWAETTFFGLKWKYLALMEGNVYDITEWANCQKSALSHLQPNSHVVQYRIVLGQNNQSGSDKRKDLSSSEPTMDDILSNIYSGQNQPNSRRRNKK